MPKYGLYRRARNLATGLSLTVWSFDDDFTGDLETTTVIGGDAPFTVDLNGEPAGVTASIDGRVITISVASTLAAGTDSFDILVTNAAGTLTVSSNLFVVTDAAVTTLAPFQITETNNATSKGFKRFGMPFPMGDVPTGSIAKVTRGGVDVPFQADGFTNWPDGSLRYCVGKIRDTDFTALENRAYSIEELAGTWGNASSLTLADITGAYNFTVEFTSITGATRGAIANLTASFNTHAAVSTRVTKYEQGPICDSWYVWGMAGADAHLVVEWYVTAWKNAVGAIVDVEFCAIPSLYWWSVATKEKLTYTATLKDGATTIQAYTNVAHVYRTQWGTFRMQNDAQHGQPHWRTACPSLLYKPDRVYWISTGLVPPLNTSKTTWTPSTNNSYISGATNTYIPGSAQNHRPGIDSQGAYNGRGVITNMDCHAFLSQTAEHVRVARVNAHVGLHVPYHYRSNSSRTRPTEGADTAATIISLILTDERGAVPATPAAYSDFTADGMPAAQHATQHSVSTATYKAGYTTPVGGTTSGGTVWSISEGASHAVSYSYFMYLLEGGRYHMQATLDLAMNLAHQLADNQWGYRANYPSNNDYFYGPGYNGAPQTLWTGICLGINGGGNDRGNGLAAMILGHAYATVPDNDVQADCFRHFHDHNFRFVDQGYAYMPQQQKDVGGWMEYQPVIGAGGQRPNLGSPMMKHLMAIGILSNYFCTRNAFAQEWGNDMANHAIGQVENRIGQINAYHAHLIKRLSIPWNETTNPWPARNDMYTHAGDSSDRITNITNSVITCNHAQSFGLTWTAGDKVMFARRNQNFTVIAVPAEVTEGVVLYVINPSGNTFQLSATPGGAAITFANFSGSVNGVYYTISAQLQSADSVTNLRSLSVPTNEDSFASMARCSVVLAHLAGSANATQVVVDKIQTALATPGGDGATWATWSYADPGPIL